MWRLTRVYRAAIIGTGRIGSLLERDALRSKPHTHAGFYASHPKVTLVAGADIDRDRLDAFGADWHIPSEHLYTDYRELLARERPDLVSICAYAPERVAMARAAIEAGARGLWLEKAVACSMAEAEELRALAQARGVAVVVNHQRRADPAYLRVRELIASGELGRLESVHVLFSGHFIHTGTHAWDLLDEWCGPWAEVRCWPEGGEEAPARIVREAHEELVRRAPPLAAPAALKRLVDETTGWKSLPAEPFDATHDPGGIAHIRFENGVHAFVSGSAKRYFIFQADLVFTAGRIQIGNDVRRVFRPAPSPRYEGFIELAESPEALGFAPVPSLLETLVAAVESGQPGLDSLDAAIRSLHLGLAIVSASRAWDGSIARGQVDLDFYAASV